MELIIVTGISGSGKSKVMDALEDIGYFCIDNLPPFLLLKLFELYNSSVYQNKNLAVVIDSRSLEFFGDIETFLNNLKYEEISYKILFIDADNKTIINRFKETRRKHPLLSEFKTLEDAISSERELVASLKEQANFYIDTTSTSSPQLREKIVGYFSQHKDNEMVINTVSFGFKNGIPIDSDLVFDVRCLPNPHYVPELKEKTGLEQEIVDYVMNSQISQTLFAKIKDYLDFSLPLYMAEGKNQLTISFGCTGGKHRSVAFAQLFHSYLKDKGYRGFKTHRDVTK